MRGLWNATRPYVRGLSEAESRALHTRVRPCKAEPRNHGETKYRWQAQYPSHVQQTPSAHMGAR